MLVPVRPLRAHLVLAVVVGLTRLTETAIFTLAIVGAQVTVRTNMEDILRRHDTIAVCTAHVFAVVKAASLA